MGQPDVVRSTQMTVPRCRGLGIRTRAGASVGLWTVDRSEANYLWPTLPPTPTLMNSSTAGKHSLITLRTSITHHHTARATHYPDPTREGIVVVEDDNYWVTPVIGGDINCRMFGLLDTSVTSLSLPPHNQSALFSQWCQPLRADGTIRDAECVVTINQDDTGGLCPLFGENTPYELHTWGYINFHCSDCKNIHFYCFAGETYIFNGHLGWIDTKIFAVSSCLGLWLD